LDCIFENRNYKNIKGWIKYDYDRVVRPSDEAFVWQVMTFYYPVWVGNNAGGGDDVVGTKNSLNSSGPKKGFNQTTGKTIKTFHKYLQAVGSSRASKNSRMWSARLKRIAQERDRENEAKRSFETRGTRVRTIADEQDTMKFMQYARLNVDGLEDEDNDSEVSMEDPTDSSAGYSEAV
jgi:hypothetical protein